MRLKNKNSSPEGGYTFFFLGKSGEAIELRSTGMRQLTELVTKTFVNQGIAVPDNIEEIIEHQICLRQSVPTDKCWSGGIGDDLHHLWIKPFLGKVEQVAQRHTGGAIKFIAKAVGNAARKVSGCSSCGGTKVYREGRNNLGRAGTLNRIVK